LTFAGASRARRTTPRGTSASAAIAAGLTPFLLGDALKAALAMGVLPTAWKFVNKR
jgi:biotin transport system substrate-specific component